MTHFHPNPTLGQIGDIVFPPVAPVLEDVTQLTSRKTVDGFPDRFPAQVKKFSVFRNHSR